MRDDGAMQELRGYAKAPTGLVHYREQGEGQPVVLLHRNPSSSIGFTRVLPLLAAAGFRAIAMDTPGYGLSDRPAAPPQAMDEYAAAVVALLDHLGLERAHLAGYHTGSSIACEVAAAHPERVDRLVLSAMMALTDEERPAYAGFAARWAPDPRGDFLGRWPLPLLRRYVTRDDPEHFMHELQAYLQAGPEYWWAIEAVFRYDAFARLPLIQAPTMVLQVAGDPHVERTTPRVAAALPQAPYIEVHDGHELLYDEPAVWADPVVAFLRSR
jgi:pimeloyl-ACP methyl ester carboxylesterase